MGTTAFVCGGVTVWGGFSLNCKLNLHVLPCTNVIINGVTYHDNVLIKAHDVPQFDNQPLSDMSIFMDDNARPRSCRSRMIREFRQQKAIDTFQLPICHVH